MKKSPSKEVKWGHDYKYHLDDTPRVMYDQLTGANMFIGSKEHDKWEVGQMGGIL